MVRAAIGNIPPSVSRKRIQIAVHLWHFTGVGHATTTCQDNSQLLLLFFYFFFLIQRETILFSIIWVVCEIGLRPIRFIYYLRMRFQWTFICSFWLCGCVGDAFLKRIFVLFMNTLNHFSLRIHQCCDGILITLSHSPAAHWNGITTRYTRTWFCCTQNTPMQELLVYFLV